MTDKKNCSNCPSFLNPQQVPGVYDRGIGSSMCRKFGTVLDKPGWKASQINKLREHVAENCASYGEPVNGSDQGRNTVVMLGNPTLRDPANIDPDKKASVGSCTMCSNYVNESTVAIELGWSAGLCAAKGKLIFSNKTSIEARGCEYRQYGLVRTSIGGLHFLPEYEDGFGGDVPLDPTAAYFASKRAGFVEPGDWPTDREVTDEDLTAGIKAWRKFLDPDGTSNEVYFPVYDSGFFDDDERALIPKTGSDEHPELYVDHFGGMYGLGVAWMELDETPVFWGQAGVGKGHPVTTKVLTPEGWRQVGDLRPGDEVIGQNGQATKVTGVYPRGVLPVNRVTMNDGSSVLVDDDHLWQVWTRKQEINWRTGEKRINPKGSVVSTRDLRSKELMGSTGYKFRIPQVQPVEFAEQSLPLDPYMLGVMLANGSLTAKEAVFSTNDLNVVEECKARGLVVTERTPTPTRRWKVWSEVWTGLKQLLLDGKLSREKFIPEVYLRSSIEDRRDLLAALLDCDGSCDGGHTTYFSMSYLLAQGVRELVQSLSGTASITRESRDGLYRVSISMPVNPFYTERKREVWDLVDHNTPSRRIASVTSEGSAEVMCISVAAEDQLYVTEDYIVTHNTELLRYAAWIMQIPFHRISVTSTTEKDDLIGTKEYSPDKGTYFRYGRLPEAWTKPGVLCLDEPNVAKDPGVWHAIRPLTDNSKQLIIDMAESSEPIERNNDCYLGLCMNPAWDVRNVGAMEIADADANRLFHTLIEMPPEALEREIIKSRVKLDGWELPDKVLDSVMETAKSIRALTEDTQLPITWAIRPQIKVARALRWFSPTVAYRRAVGDFLEPEALQILLDQVRANFPTEEN